MENPLMNWLDVISSLRGAYNIKQYAEMPGFTLIDADPNKEYLAPLNTKNEDPTFPPVEYSDVRTVSKLVKYVKGIPFQGVLLIGVRDHVLAIHKWGGKTYVVDNEGKFTSRSKILSVGVITDPPAKAAFDAWLRSTDKHENVKKV